MVSVYRIFACAALSLLLVSCGPAGKALQGSRAGKDAGATELKALDRKQAEDAVRPLMPDGADYRAFSYVKDGKLKAASVCISAPDLDEGYLRASSFMKVGNRWESENSADVSVSSHWSEKRTTCSFIDSCYLQPGPDPVFFFNVLESENDGRMRYYSACCFNPETYEIHQAFFEGRETGADGKIEGRVSPLSESVNGVPALRQSLLDNPRLIKLSEGDFFTEEVISWWLDNNPAAMTAARKIAMPVLPEVCSLKEQYAHSGYTASSGHYRVAMFDYRGYTSVVAYDKLDGTYLLVWTEPECRNHSKDRLLNGIRFEKGLLEMHFYQGSRFFKYKINIASKTISR